MATAAVAAALPWHRSGSATRTGFELARSVDRAGLVTAPWQRALLVAAFLLPLLAALSFLAVAAGRARWAGMAACASAVVGLASAAVVIRLSDVRQVGPPAAIATAVVAGLCGARLLGRKSCA